MIRDKEINAPKSGLLIKNITRNNDETLDSGQKAGLVG